VVFIGGKIFTPLSDQKPGGSKSYRGLFGKKWHTKLPYFEVTKAEFARFKQ
jgi:hypothetical protein